MNPILRDLYDQQRAAVENANKILANADASENDINAVQKSLEAIQAKITLAETAEANVNDTPEEAKPASGKTDTQTYNAELFYKAITGRLNGDEKAVVNNVMQKHRAQLNGTVPEDGGYVVPEDFTTEIIKSIMDEESVRNLVRVESVSTLSGRRIVRTGIPNLLFNTEERGAIQMMNNPEYSVIPYRIQKYAGLMDVPNELLDDAFINFIDEIRTWFSDAARETENQKIFYGSGTNDPMGMLNADPYYIEHPAPATMDIKALRNIKNKLNQGYRVNSRWIMNTLGFELLSNIVDGVGRGILAEDPRQPDAYTLFGRPVNIYDTITTAANGRTTIAFGDFNRGYRMFDRKMLEFRLTDTGAGAFETDTVKARGVERFDGQRMDSEAIVIVRNVDVSALA
jgi:HK97 family phage major capsid protein